MSSDYLQYRGKCKELSQQAVAADPSLELVRGTYVCPMWGEQHHWWCKTADGTIVDPSVAQFPTKGIGAEYVEFDGIVHCANCHQAVPEEHATFDGRYAFCSTKCNMRFVGL